MAELWAWKRITWQWQSNLVGGRIFTKRNRFL